MLKLKYVWVWMALVAGPSAARADFALGVTGQPAANLSSGFLVLGVTPDFAADQLGIRVGDVIYDVNGISVTTSKDLHDALNASGGRVVISWLVNGNVNKALAESALLVRGPDPAGKSKPSTATQIRVSKPSRMLPTKRQ